MQIAWIGLGNMGRPMTSNLVEAGYSVRAYDVSSDARTAAAGSGIEIAGSAADAASGADVVFTMLPSGELVRRVLVEEGVLECCRSGAIVVDSSTIDIADARDLHEIVAAGGRRFLDAPVSGGVSGATAGTLTFMVGGDPAVLAEVSDVLQAMAGRIFHTGGPASGQTTKIVNNLMVGINLAGLCEGVTLAGRLGLDPKILYDVAMASSGDSWVLRTWFPVEGIVDSAAVNRDFEAGFATDLMAKDLGLALEAGRATSTDLSCARWVHDAMQALSEAGHGARDCTILVRRMEGTL